MARTKGATGKTKIDKALDWLGERNTEWNYHQEFWKFVSPPANPSFNEILGWLNSKVELFLASDEEPPFHFYNSDIARWKENNQEKLIGTQAIALHKKQGHWVGIDSYRTLASVLGQMAYLTNIYFETLKKQPEPDPKKVLVLEKLAARTALTAEALSNLELYRDKQELGLGFAYQLANDVQSMASQDPSATPQMREWLINLLDAGLSKLEEQAK